MSATAASATAVVIDDDPDVRELLVDVLSGAGFTVIAVDNGVDGVDAVRLHTPDITTLDVNMPGIDGFETARRIRSFSDTHILLITALTDETDAVMGFGAGADDVITKPFRARELRARIVAAQRRRAATVAPTAGATAALATAPAGTLGSNGLQVNRATRAALLNGEALSLTRTEFELLAALLEAAPTVLSKSDLVRVLHDEPGDRRFGVTDAEERAIETHMGNLRRKLGDSAAEPRFIETLRAVGYRAVTSARQSGG